MTTVPVLPQRLFLVLLLFISACATNKIEPEQPDAMTMEEVKKRVSQKHIPRQIRDKIFRLYHQDPVERAWAAYQLAKIGRGAAPAVPYLIDTLNDDTSVLLSRYLGGGYRSSSDTTPGDEASKALAKIGEPANKELLKALQHSNANSRRLAAKALGQINDTSSIKPLIALLDDPDRRVRATVAIALGHFRHPKAAQIIMDAIPGASESARANMVYALAQINDIIVVPFLIKLIAKEDPNVRAAIVHALGKMRDARGVNQLLKSLSDEDEIVRANSVYALSYYYAPHVIDALVKALQDELERVREAAGEALSILTGKQFGADYGKWQAWWNKQQEAMDSRKKKQKSKTGNEKRSKKKNKNQ